MGHVAVEHRRRQAIRSRQTAGLSDHLAQAVCRRLRQRTHHAPLGLSRFRRLLRSALARVWEPAYLAPALLAAVPIALFGVALSKWLSTIMGSLLRRKRARGETIVALIGAVAGLGGALAARSRRCCFVTRNRCVRLRWTPPGALPRCFISVSIRMTASAYVLAISDAFGLFTLRLITGTYWIARRAALGNRRTSQTKSRDRTTNRPAHLRRLGPCHCYRRIFPLLLKKSCVTRCATRRCECWRSCR